MFDFITVVFKEEVPLLEVQARSLDLYVTNVDQITVVVNDTKEVANSINPAWWGKHSSKVVVILGNQYNISGWGSQQLLKLHAASKSISTWSIVLDAKTWFVKVFDVTKLFGINGKPYVGSVPGKADVFVQGREFVEQYYNIQMPKVIGPNGVPYMFHTATVKDMISEFDNFVDFFITNVQGPNFITEFFLYSGYVIKKYGSIEELYNTSYTYLFPLNIAENEATEFDTIFDKINKYPKAVLTASIHRNAYKKLTQDQLLTWGLFLAQRNLILDPIETQNLLNTYIK